MTQTAQGLVFRTWPLTETSLIVHWLTPDFGRLATVAKGARRVNSAFRGKLDLFYLLDFSFSRSARSDLHTLREATLRETHSSLRHDLTLLRQASYCSALIERTTETNTPLPEVFTLMLGLLAHLNAGPPQPQTMLAFELKLLAELGLAPDLAASRLRQPTGAFAAFLTAADWPELGTLVPNDEQLKELSLFLQRCLAWQLGKPIKGRAEALAVVPGSGQPAPPPNTPA
jgi:DNA repair protein RecO (recombination protein O)